MEPRLTVDNLDQWFDAKEAVIASRDAEYWQLTKQIRWACHRGTPDDVRFLVEFLRPWDIEKERNWIGKEWLRMVAMQALCFLGRNDRCVAEFLSRLLTEEDPLNDFTPEFAARWRRETDVSCLPDPKEDFHRCIREALECIAHETG